MIKKDQCPHGDKEVDFVNLGHRQYVFCYVCQCKYFEEDYAETNESVGGKNGK